jgi:hypothetical protein
MSNTHLMPDQISRLLAGLATNDDERHVEDCPVCRSARDAAVRDLALFRSGVRSWTQEHESGLPAASFAESRSGRRESLWLRGALVLCLLMLASLPFAKYRMERQKHEAVQDAQLLDEVNAHIVRTVPAPMEPFFELLLDQVGNSSTEESDEID